MRIFVKFFIFSVFFSILFFTIRTTGILPSKMLLENIFGITALYSTVALIFSIISAFIIQNQWTRWINLETSIKEEINSLWELHIFSLHLEKGVRSEINIGIKNYIKSLLDTSWQDFEKGELSRRIEFALRDLERNIISMLKKYPEDKKVIFSIFTDILRYRNERIHYSTGQLPILLYILISFSTILVIFLSFFVYVDGLIIDYIFTFSIALLVFLVFTVIQDLNHPFRPGSWHLSKNIYENLFQMIEGKKSGKRSTSK